MNITIAENKRDCLMRDFRVGQFFSLLNGMPGRKKWVERTLAFAPTGANIAFVLEHFPDAEWTDGSETMRDNYIALKMEEENTRQEKSEQLVDSSGYEFNTVPFAHQLQAFLLSRDRETFALFHEQGTGKTKVIIDNAAYLYEKGEIDTLIVVAKNGVHINWVIEEIPIHMPPRIPHMSTYFSINWRERELNNMMEAATSARGMLRILTFHVEGIKYLRDGELGKLQRLIERWLKNSKAMVVVDESSTIKHHSADRTKFMVKMRPLSKYRRIMTGTPMTSGIENLYSQFLFLDPRILGYESFYTYRAKFCIMGGFEGRQIVNYKNIEELTKVLDGHSHRVLKKDCLDLPPKIYKLRPFELGTAQLRLYEAYRKSIIEELQAILGKELGLQKARDISIVRALRLHQIVCGMTPTENPQRLEGSDPRMTAFLEELEEATAGGGKAIIFARFKLNLFDIMKTLGKEAVPYYGGIKEDERILSVKRFQNDHTARYFVASSAAAYGLTLTAANNTLFYSQSSSLDIRLQSEDRNHRIGTTGLSVNYTDFVAQCKASPDKKIIKNLRAHKNLADQINRDPISIFLEEEDE